MNYKKLVPANSPIGMFMRYMDELETATSYDFWSAVWALGTACGRRVQVARPRIPVFLNWYIILVAESGNTRKSTAVLHAKKWYADCTGESGNVIDGRTTSTALVQLLGFQSLDHGYCTGALAVSELASVLGRGPESMGLPILLTDLYDCEEQKTLPGSSGGGSITLRNPFVTLLSASTPTWLATVVSPQVIEGGFTSRVMFVTDESRKRAIAWPSVPNDDTWNESVKLLRERVRDVRALADVPVNAKARSTLSKWYRNKPHHRSPFLNSFEAREDDHVLRLAACLAINDGTFEIQARHISASTSVIEDVKVKANALFGGDYSEANRLADGIEKIREVLVAKGADGILHRELYMLCRYRLDAKEFTTLLTVMHEAGLIQRFFYRKAEKRAGTYIYRATVKLLGPGVISEVLARLNLEKGSA